MILAASGGVNIARRFRRKMLAQNNTAPRNAINTVSAAAGVKMCGAATWRFGSSRATAVRKKNVITHLTEVSS